MADQKTLYVGSAMQIPKGGTKVQLDLTDLWEYTKGEAKHKIRAWKDKTGKEHKTIDLLIFPMKEENQRQYATHSVKIDMWEKPVKDEDVKIVSKDDIPF